MKGRRGCKPAQDPIITVVTTGAAVVDVVVPAVEEVVEVEEAAEAVSVVVAIEAEEDVVGEEALEVIRVTPRFAKLEANGWSHSVQKDSRATHQR